MIQNHWGISGEPSKGIVYEDSEEGITLKYDPNTQFITFWEDDTKYDQMDCSFFSDWDSVLKELYSEYGINLLHRVHNMGKKITKGCSLLQL